MRKLLLLITCLNLSERPSATNATLERAARLFSPFHIVSFRKYECTAATGDKGTCQTASECAGANGGAASGSCALGFGVCCVVTRTGCGGTVDTNCTYVASPGFPGRTTTAMACSWRFRKAAADVCFMRLDYDAFSIAGPDVGAPSPGDCAVDVVTFDVGGAAEALPPVCGENAGQHFYYDLGPAGSLAPTLTMNLALTGSATARVWRMKFSQVRCGQRETPPSHCGNYVTGVHGLVRSFNFVNAANFRHLNNQEYSVCVRQEAGFCSLRWTPTMDTFAFKLSQSPTTPVSGQGAKNGPHLCAADYIQIARGHNGDNMCTFRRTGTNLNDVTSSVDTFCGSFLNCIIGDQVHTPIFTDSFILGVSFNFQDNVGVNDNRGFSLTYTQIPC